MTVVAIVFWVAAALIVYTQVGYALLLALIAKLSTATRRAAPAPAGAAAALPKVSVIIAAYNEESVIAARIANLRALDYPPELLEIIVASDGSADSTAAHARAAGADLVLELARGGKLRAQDTSVARAGGAVLAFTDANSDWQPDALRRIVDAFADPRIGYVCGNVSFVDAGGTNQEGLYWRYEMWIRRLESGLRSVTSGNGAIYATRSDSYMSAHAVTGHDVTFPFNMVKHGWRAVYVTAARATEKMVPSLDGEFARKRRMARMTWPIVWGSGLISPRGYDPMYAWMIYSHRLLRYLTPFLHGLALITSLVLIGQSWVYVVCAAAQLALIGAALLATVIPNRVLLVARYYVVTNWALALGLWDWLRGERAPVWEIAEGTR